MYVCRGEVLYIAVLIKKDNMVNHPDFWEQSVIIEQIIL